MFVFKKHLSRRTVLKGAGATIAEASDPSSASPRCQLLFIVCLLWMGRAVVS